MTLDGHVAAVTGAASGIGAATARALTAAGATVAVIDRDAAGLERIGAELEGCGVFVVDLSDLGSIPSLVHAVAARHGTIDILVNAAGIAGAQGSILDTTLDEWDLIHAVDLKAPFLLIQHVARRMIEDTRPGRIVNVTSSSAFRAEMTGAAYAAAKAGLTQLTRTAAADLAPHGINVNAVAPGVTETAMTAALDHDALEALVAGGPLKNLFGRVSTPDDVAAVIRFLCEPASRQITAQTIHVSAGAVT